MKTKIFALGITAFVLAGCGSSSYTTSNVDDIYYSAKDATKNNANKRNTDPQTEQLKAKTQQAIDTKTVYLDADKVYMKNPNTVHIEGHTKDIKVYQNDTLLALDDENSYERRLSMFDDPRYTIEIDMGYDWYRPYYGWGSSYHWGWRPGYLGFGWSNHWGFGWDWGWPYYGWALRLGLGMELSLLRMARLILLGWKLPVLRPLRRLLFKQPFVHRKQRIRSKKSIFKRIQSRTRLCSRTNYFKSFKHEVRSLGKRNTRIGDNQTRQYERPFFKFGDGEPCKLQPQRCNHQHGTLRRNFHRRLKHQSKSQHSNI